MKKVDTLVEDVSNLSEFLWAVHQIDIDRLKNRVDTSEEFAKQSKDAAKRMVRHAIKIQKSIIFYVSYL